MPRIRLLCVCFLFVSILGARAGAQIATSGIEDLPHVDLTPAFSDERISPTAYIFGGAALLTAITLRYDQPVYDHIHALKEHNGTVRALSPIITEMGTGGFAAGLLGSFAAYGYVNDDSRAIEVARVGTVSFLATGIAVQLVKQLSGRERPETSTRPGGFWNGPFSMMRNRGDKSKGIGSYDAFASGHTTSAFSLATVFSDVYEDKPWVGYVSYSLASLVAISRITERTHWASDCIVGAMIGIYGTKAVEGLMRVSPDVTVTPIFLLDGEYGLCMTVPL